VVDLPLATAFQGKVHAVLRIAAFATVDLDFTPTTTRRRPPQGVRWGGLRRSSGEARSVPFGASLGRYEVTSTRQLFGAMLICMALSERVQRALAAASALSREERRELITELALGLARERAPKADHDEAWAAEIRRRVDAVVSGESRGVPWSQVRHEIEGKLAERAATRNGSRGVVD
jgi:putative addiction module component (TIGR02574 family)